MYIHAYIHTHVRTYIAGTYKSKCDRFQSGNIMYIIIYSTNVHVVWSVTPCLTHEIWMLGMVR